MYKNINYFSQNLKLDNIGLESYISLLENRLIINPIIFTDICSIYLNVNIPIYHSSFIRHSFYKKIIIVDCATDLMLLNNVYKNHCSIIYVYDNILDIDKTIFNDIICIDKNNFLEILQKELPNDYRIQ